MIIIHIPHSAPHYTWLPERKDTAGGAGDHILCVKGASSSLWMSMQEGTTLRRGTSSEYKENRQSWEELLADI